MKTALARFFLALAIATSASASYRIGQSEIPEVKVHEDAASFKVHEGHPRLFFRASDLPTIRERVAVGSSRVDLQACKLEYSIVSPK